MKFPCFADDYQGLAASVLAATLGAIPDTRLSLKDHRIVVMGSGPHRVCIAEMLASAISFESRGMASEARQNIFLFDSDGLVTSDSPHAEREDEEMREVLLYSKDMTNSKDINEVLALFVEVTCHDSKLRLFTTSKCQRDARQGAKAAEYHEHCMSNVTAKTVRVVLEGVFYTQPEKYNRAKTKTLKHQASSTSAYHRSPSHTTTTSVYWIFHSSCFSGPIQLSQQKFSKLYGDNCAQRTSLTGRFTLKE